MVLYSSGCIILLITNSVLAQYIYGPPSPRTDNMQDTLSCFQAGIELADMANYQPVGRYPASYNPSVCVKYCVQIKCKSFVYDSVQKVCYIYNVRVHESSAYLKYHPCRNYYELSHICKKSRTTPGGPSYIYSTSSSSPASICTSTDASTTTTTLTPTTTAKFLGDIYYEISDVTIFIPDCNPDEKVAINGQVGVEVTDEPTFETKEYINFEDCLDRCVQNLGQGSQLLKCKAFQYDVVTLNCALFNFKPTTAAPNDALAVLYGQKVCLPADVVSLCSNEVPSILTGPDNVLIGNVLEEIGSVTFEECVAACFKDTACKSGNYYPTTKECLLKDITRTTNPALYIGEIGTTYFDHDCA